MPLLSAINKNKTGKTIARLHGAQGLRQCFTHWGNKVDFWGGVKIFLKRQMCMCVLGSLF